LGSHHSWHIQKFVVDDRHPLYNMNPGLMLEKCVSWVRQAKRELLRSLLQ